MINEKLVDFLCLETAFEEIGDEQLLHHFPEFGETVGLAINSNSLLKVSAEFSDLFRGDGSIQSMSYSPLYRVCL